MGMCIIVSHGSTVTVQLNIKLKNRRYFRLPRALKQIKPASNLLANRFKLTNRKIELTYAPFDRVFCLSEAKIKSQSKFKLG
jgi:hypothetical protein